MPKYSSLKSTLDFIVGLLCLVICSPLLLIIGVLVLFDSGLPVFFCQERAGLRGKPFRVIKFRTMVNDAVNIGLGRRTSSTDPRVTRIGKLLREFHLDELPQLINVTLGEMSLVGPRPTLVSQAASYNDIEAIRLNVKPGLTGLAQVSGNNELSWEERIKYDVHYANHMSLSLDLSIMIRTVSTVLFRRGVYGLDGMVHDKGESNIGRS